MPKPVRLPATLGASIDLGLKLERERLAYQKEVEAKIAEMELREKTLDDHILGMLEAQGLDKAAGAEASVSLSKQPIPTVKDWGKFYAYIKKTGQFDLLEKRPARGAYRERVEAGLSIPGVETYWNKKLYFGQIKK